MDEQLVLEGGEFGGRVVLLDVSIVSSTLRVTVTEEGAVIELLPGQKMTLVTQRPEPR